MPILSPWFYWPVILYFILNMVESTLWRVTEVARSPLFLIADGAVGGGRDKGGRACY